MIVDELRVVGSTQTNVVMAAELTRVAKRALGVRPPAPRKEGLGQLVYPFEPGLAWAAATYLRTPTRVVWDVFRARATRLEPLYDELCADLADDRRRFFRDGDGLSIEARRVDAFAAGPRQIVGTVKNALIDVAARRGVRLHVDPERPTLRWVVRQDDAGDVVVSIDLGGGSLSQRGWRQEAGDAPLRSSVLDYASFIRSAYVSLVRHHRRLGNEAVPLVIVVVPMVMPLPPPDPNATFAPLMRAVNSLAVESYQRSPFDGPDGSPATEPTLMPAVVAPGENVMRPVNV